jgi:hypothetical protein
VGAGQHARGAGTGALDRARIGEIAGDDLGAELGQVGGLLRTAIERPHREAFRSQQLDHRPAERARRSDNEDLHRARILGLNAADEPSVDRRHAQAAFASAALKSRTTPQTSGDRVGPYGGRLPPVRFER